MVYLTYLNKENEICFEFSDNILKISDYLVSLLKYRHDNFEPLPLLDVKEDIFNIFKIWFNELNKCGIVDYTKFNIAFVIFKPELLDSYNLKTLIDLFNFGFANQIKLLCETVAYVIASRNILISKFNDHFYISTDDFYEFTNGKHTLEILPIYHTLLLMILKNMSEEKFNSQPDYIRCLAGKRKIIIEYSSHVNSITEENIYKNKPVIDNDDYYGKKFYVIPYNTTVICEDAFKTCSRITEIKIPNSVTRIENGAFSSCIKLTSVDIPKSVKHISDSAFENCVSLSKIKIHDSVTIGENVFYGCESLELTLNNILYKVPINIIKYSIPDNVTKIEDYAFKDCKIVNIQIPNSIKVIGKGAFKGCSYLLSLDFPNSITSIEERIFEECKNLCKINIPNSITYIGPLAFGYCMNLRDIAIPDNVKILDQGAFYNCRNLETVSLSTSLTKIYNSTFNECINLTSINLSPLLTHIADSAFRKCAKLTSVNIPSSVTKIDKNAFTLCSELVNVNMSDNVDLDNDVFKNCENLELIHKNTLVSVPKHVLTYTIPNGIIKIGRQAFKYSNITEVNIPESVKIIEEEAFYESKLKNIVIPASVNTIQKYAFFGCSELKNVDIKNKDVSVGLSAFGQCNNLIKDNSFLTTIF